MTNSTKTHSVQQEQLHPSGLVRRFLSRDRTPISVLLLSAVVGVVTGYIGTFFEMAVSWISENRTSLLKESVGDHLYLVLASILVSAVLAVIGFVLVRHMAPESGGSGIPEIEGAMDEIRPVRWWRVLPAKFIGGLGALGSGMVLGREGPTVQMGGNIGSMISDIFRLRDKEGRHSLLAAGAAGGLAAAFNAPLAGIMFVVEEMRPQFRYSLISIKCVTISAVLSTVVFRSLRGQEAIISMPSYIAPQLESLWLFLLLGVLFGVFGVLFNKLVVMTLDGFVKFHRHDFKRYLIMAASIGGFFGLLIIYLPQLTNGGIFLIPEVAAGNLSISLLLMLFLARLAVTLISFGSGAPGGIFAPMLALGTLFGTVFGVVASHFFPSLGLEPGMFAIAGMGALFTATVRAPVTGILLVIEMTGNYELILPLIITTIGATILAQALGGKPIYSQLLERTLDNEAKARKEKELAEEASKL
ncbi:H(+)/Cl(-) exchange transporter ClcA [Vibrio sp. SS-MA-C1-2]|uniref:H(+)/Cl(-) exchange transporter ClcA n=1 Tax=Vibrio sp. SS-MA-C1-2 TaxID=2908646 RepID=UPI001F264608|nr:H(+)/Cl(-) exchange transporter ClcA [Vibrio sp. SS-MA-C1-2]UJF19648.1 H(+)/Cl(-) exchange transporter ClcA [Vibrio sp. SS-MA-C1-2]